MKYIFGFGTYTRGDDSIGLRIVEYIQNNNLETNFKAVDIGNDNYLFLTYFTEDVENMLIIDAADIALDPGDFLIFSPDDVVSKKTINNISTHEGDVIKSIEFAKKLGYPIPRIKILGIQPKNLDFNKEISQELKNNFQIYINAALEEIGKVYKNPISN